MNWYVKWKAKRELKKTAKLVRMMCDKMPLSFFENLVFTAAGTPLEPLSALNTISSIASKIERGEV